MRINRDNTRAVIIDVQERLLPHIDRWEATRDRIVTLIQGLNILGVPLTLTEQYPQGLGPTVPEVLSAFPVRPQPIVKSSFSCCDDKAFSETLDQHPRDGVVLVAGIESHVCVLQTTMDLLDRGYSPVVVADAVSSRYAMDREIALRRIEQEGARLTTVESVLFELTRVSGTPEFKKISRLVK